MGLTRNGVPRGPPHSLRNAALGYKAAVSNPDTLCFPANTRSLKHLCRLKIRKCLGRLRLRCPVFLTFLPLPNPLKEYILYKEYDLYGQGNLKGTY